MIERYDIEFVEEQRDAAEAQIAALREDIARLRRELWDACNIDWPVLGTLAKENDALRSTLAAKDREIAALRRDITRLRRELWDRCNTDPAEAMRAKYEATGGFVDVDRPTLERLRKAAREQEKVDTYTWIAPGHVLAMIDTIGELEGALADTTARAIRAALKGNGEGNG
jgi:hypothetical protein